MAAIDGKSIAELASGRDRDGLERHLRDTSNLPGPRANLKAAAALATALANGDIDWAIGTIERWSEIGPDRAGGNEPGVMLPFTASQAAGALWNGASLGQRQTLDAILRRAANDPRWRVREGAALGLQRIGFADFDALRKVTDRWRPGATLLEHRAIVAGLAEPPLMNTPERAASGLDRAIAALHALLAVPAANRKNADAQALRKALGYALSVFIAAEPAGFARLDHIARIPDKDAAWIVRENLKKARLAKPYPDRCAATDALLL